MQSLKIAAISDTHGKHAELNIKNVDLLFHLGDFSFKPFGAVRPEGMSLRLFAANLFLEWFGKQAAKYKFLVAGNHDTVCEKQDKEFRELCSLYGVHYLQHEHFYIAEFKLKLFGTPFTTYDNFPGASAFHINDQQLLSDKMNQMPDDLNIIISHNAPLNMFDKDAFGKHHGCKYLRKRVDGIKPKLHLFGHVHNSYGTRVVNNTTFVNACLVNNKEEICNEIVYLTVAF